MESNVKGFSRWWLGLAILAGLVFGSVACSNSPACAATIMPNSAAVQLSVIDLSGAKPAPPPKQNTGSQLKSGSSAGNPTAKLPPKQNSGGQTLGGYKITVPSTATLPKGLSSSSQWSKLRSSPPKLTLGGSYVDPYNHKSYLYHPPTYYVVGVYDDPLNPYDVRNYTSDSFSPYYGLEYDQPVAYTSGC
jgi:hypothetical protein